MRRRRTLDVAVLAAFLGVSFLYFGWRLLPHPSRVLVGAQDWPDPQIAVWFFGWWPHAILSGANPFVSSALYAPEGVNVAASNGIPGLAIVFAPLTLIAGPSVSYNVAAVMLPALSAWTAYLLLRSLTGATFAAAVGGYLYGFSSFILAHQLGGHVVLTAAFIVPLLALVLLRFFRGELDGRGLALRFGLLLAFQAYVSLEIATTAGLILVVVLALGYLLVPSGRSRISAALAPIAAGSAGAIVLAAPFLYYILVAFATHSKDNSSYSADLLNLIVPTSVIALGGHALGSVAAHFPGVTNERDSYVGVPTLIIAALALGRRPWSATVRVSVMVFALATLLSFGPELIVDGHRVVELPTEPLYRLPFLREAIPSRFAVFASLALAVLVAGWLSGTNRRMWWYWRGWRIALAALAVGLLVPPFWTTMFVQTPARVAFFSDGINRRCFPPDETLLVFPFGIWSSSALWQAEAGFSFRLIGSGFGPMPARYADDPVMSELFTNLFTLNATSRPAPSAAQLVALVRRWHIQRVVVAVGALPVFPYTAFADHTLYPTARMMRAFGSVERVGGALVAPACGRPPFGAAA